MKRILVATALTALTLGGCASSPSSNSSPSAAPASTTSSPSTTAPATETASLTPSRAVVIVSGGGATTPFTTPTEACRADAPYLSAGNTATGLREYLLAQGKQVYTAPTMAGWGVVQESKPDDFGPFADCPTALPESLTIMATGDINAGGERLAHFLNYLNTEYGVTDVDLVGHSNGGLWSRSAIWVLKHTDSPVKVRSLAMLGSPIEGSVPGMYTWGEIPLSECMGNTFCEGFNKKWVRYANLGDRGINHEDTEWYLTGPDGWNMAQGNALDGIPVTLLAGAYFTAKGGNPKFWPYDGITSQYSAWATTVPDSIIPHRACWVGPLTHSIFVSNAAKLKWDTALTWNKDALARVNQSIDESDTAMSAPNRQGCQ